MIPEYPDMDFMLFTIIGLLVVAVVVIMVSVMKDNESLKPIIIALIIIFGITIPSVIYSQILLGEWEQEIDKIIPTLSCSELREIYFGDYPYYAQEQSKDRFLFDCPHGEIQK